MIVRPTFNQVYNIYGDQTAYKQLFLPQNRWTDMFLIYIEAFIKFLWRFVTVLGEINTSLFEPTSRAPRGRGH